MKKLSLLAALTVALTLGSCSNDQESGNHGSNNGEIGFRTFIDKGGDTRATITNGDNILGFTVTGWWNKTGTATTDVGDADKGGYLFNAVDITRRETAMTIWNYDPKLYWPSEGNGVYFFAYSPASSENVATGLYNYKAATQLKYTVPNPGDKESQEDFLLARTDVMDGKPGGSGSVVNLNFAHALSRVKFYAKKKNNLEHLNYLVKSVEMVNINKTGTIDLANIPTSGNFTYTSGTPVVLWTSSSSGKISVDLGDSPIYVKDGATYNSILGETNALMVMPQETVLGDPANPASGFLVKVEYKAFIDITDAGTYYAGTPSSWKTVYFAVPTTSGGTDPHIFEIGRQYNFCLTFGNEAGEPISFVVQSVGEWNDAPQIDLPQITDYYGAGLISEALAKIANPTNWNKPENGGVSLGDILQFSSLSVDNITKSDDLKGLGYFTNLTNISLGNSGDVKVDIDLTGLRKLTDLYLCGDLKIGTLDISDIKNNDNSLSVSVIPGKLTGSSSSSSPGDKNELFVDKMLVWNKFKKDASPQKISFSFYSGDPDSCIKIASVVAVNGAIDANISVPLWLGSYRILGSNPSYPSDGKFGIGQ